MNGFVESLTRIVEHLEAAQLDYMIVGSVASTIYGEPRLTRDIDLVLSLKLASAATFIAALPSHLYYVPPSEIVTQEIQRKGQFNLLDQIAAFKIDIIFCKSNPHSVAEFLRRRRLQILPTIEAWVAAPEDVIIKKLQYFVEGRSEKHLIDIRGIIANTELDHMYLKEWIQSLCLTDAWQAAQ